jgi:hypothetical protein
MRLLNRVALVPMLLLVVSHVASATQAAAVHRAVISGEVVRQIAGENL